MQYINYFVKGVQLTYYYSCRRKALSNTSKGKLHTCLESFYFEPGDEY